MKRRCTNSACRAEMAKDLWICPRCGKQYPRVRCDRLASQNCLILMDTGLGKLRVVKLLRNYTGGSLIDARDLVLRAPSLVCTGLSPGDAQALQKELQQLDATARILPVAACKKGVFVLRK